jgi:hypothetical protein
MAKFVGEKIRRSIIDDEGFEIGYSIGVVSKWTPAGESGVFSERSGEPVELWKVKPLEYCLYEQGGGIEYAVR